MTELQCFYSLSSPWAYSGGPQLQDIVRRHRVKLVLKPYDFQEVVPRTGGVPLRTRPEPRRTYHAEELDRWRKYLGMPLTLVPSTIRRTASPQAGTSRRLDGDRSTAAAAWMRRCSRTRCCARCGRKRGTPADAAVRVAIANENGLPGKELLAAETSDQVQKLYRQYSEEAEKLGVFGAPTYVLDGVRYWGQDRLDFVDRALAAR
jgi:2-hydroxychromene-2-carboxylate isomerase